LYTFRFSAEAESGMRGRWRSLRADLRSQLLSPDKKFDQVVMLAVLEHLTEPDVVLRETYRLLAAEGTLILTWPSAMVGPILRVLHGLHLVSDEMESDEHQEGIPVATLEELLQRDTTRGNLHPTRTLLPQSSTRDLDTGDVHISLWRLGCPTASAV